MLGIRKLVWNVCDGRVDHFPLGLHRTFNARIHHPISQLLGFIEVEAKGATSVRLSVS